MQKDTSIPLQAVRLAIGYLPNNLTVAQKDELDNWNTDSDGNMKMFGDLTAVVDKNVFDPDQLLIETDEAIDLWVISGLIVHHQQGLNNKVEENTSVNGSMSAKETRTYPANANTRPLCRKCWYGLA